jgi:GNAT superfamily N-acetyltransferase
LDRHSLLEDWKCRECFLLAEEALSVAGFLDMTVEREGWQGWIRHLVIHRPFRRQGVASVLLEAAEAWARGSELTRVTAVLQTKNDPAIRLLMGHGYAFRGYIDRYFGSGDMAMLYTREL